MALSWKSNFTNTEFRIFRGKVIAGLLKTSIWKSEAYGELDGNLLRFKTTGFWQKKAQIKDIDEKKILGQIEFQYLKGAATITYDGITYDWKFGSWSRRNWLVSTNGQQASFKLNGFWQKSGEVENEGIPAAVILASFFVFVHFRKISAAVH